MRTIIIALALLASPVALADESPDAITNRGGIVASAVHETPSVGPEAPALAASKSIAKCGRGWVDTCDADGNCNCLPEL